MMVAPSRPARPRRFRLPGRRLSLAATTAGVAGLSAVANVMAVAAPPADPAPTRLGASIQQSAQERDEALTRQRRGIDLREQALKASESRMKVDLENRQPQAGAPFGSSRQADPAAGETPYDDLARIYQTMKPARAAPIFERLDMDVQIAIARRMRERSTALIMAGMSPAGAVRLSMALAGKRVDDRPAMPRMPVASISPVDPVAARPVRRAADQPPVMGAPGRAPQPRPAQPAPGRPSA